MDTFNKLTAHLRQHVWCLVALAALLIFWLGAFSLAGKGSDIASWVSILFAVVVIVYMVIQGHEMRNLVEEGHRLMAEKAGTMAERAGKVATESISQIMGKILQKFEGFPRKMDTTHPVETNNLRFDASNARIFVLFILYAAAQSCKLYKRMSIREIVPAISRHALLEDKKLDKVREAAFDQIAMAGLGLVLALECFLPPDSVIAEPAKMEVEIRNLPPGFEERIDKELTRRAKEPPVLAEFENFVETSMQKIDAYFEKS